MTPSGSERIARTLAEHPPRLDPPRRAAMEEELVVLARLRRGGAARTREELTELLRALPPSLDAEARARIEEDLVASQRRRSPARLAPRVATAVLVAAAAALALWVAPSARAPVAVAPADGAPALQYVRRARGRAPLRGTVHAPQGFDTAADAAVTLERGATRLSMGPSSRARVTEASEATLSLELDVGQLRVAFHPRAPGRQGLVVHTPSARVEVVGTVFTVAVEADGSTVVTVREGVVRVIGTVDGDVRRLGAGERVRVDGPGGPAPLAEGATPAAAASSPGPEAGDAVVAEGAAPATVTPAALGDAGRFREAVRLFDRGRYAEARAILQPVLRSAPGKRARALTIVAETYQREGDLEAAAEAYGEAVRQGAGTTHGANASYALGRLAERRLGDPQRARAAYVGYLEMFPDGPLASQARLALCRLGDAEQCR